MAQKQGSATLMCGEVPRGANKQAQEVLIMKYSEFVKPGRHLPKTTSYLTKGACSWHPQRGGVGACGKWVSRDGTSQAINAISSKGTILLIIDGDDQTSWWVCKEHKQNAIDHNEGKAVYEVDRYGEVTKVPTEQMFEVSFRFFTKEDMDVATVKSRAEAMLNHTMLQEDSDSWKYLKVIETT